MKKVIFGLCMFVAFLAVFNTTCLSFAEAGVVTLDTQGLNADEVASLARLQKKAEESTQNVLTVDEVEKWARIGDKVATALASAAKALSVEVNEFIKTPVGMIATGLIVYEVVGEDLIDLFGGSLAWLLISCIVLFSFRHFHMNERVVAYGKRSYIARYEFSDDENEIWSAVIHVVVFVTFTVMCLAIVF